MRFNVFQFGDSYYRQKEGGEMGSPFTCIWTILILSIMEMLVLMPKHKKNVIVFKRHADDVLIIWRKQGEYDDSFQEFKRTLNNISNLDRECEELSEAVNFYIWMKQLIENQKDSNVKHI